MIIGMDDEADNGDSEREEFSLLAKPSTSAADDLDDDDEEEVGDAF